MYTILDIETTIHQSFKRKANPFDPRNWIVLTGWKHAGDAQCSHVYNESDPGRILQCQLPEATKVLVGANFKFDLLYMWRDPQLIEFFKRGGWVWDVLYAEYLLSGQHHTWQLNPNANLDTLSEKYGGTQKIDAVKALWQQGVNTPDIPRDLLIDYLVGTKEEGRNGGDIGNTERVFLAQVARAKELGMLKAIKLRMDGLCCTTEMEYNGLKVDIVQARKNLVALAEEEAQIEADLVRYVPTDLPKELEFSWTNARHLSAIIFGGTIRYEKRVVKLNEDGSVQRTKGKTLGYCLNGEWIPLMDFDQSIHPYADTYSSGKRKGEFKTKLVEIPGYIKTRMEDFGYTFPRVATPDPKTATKNVDFLGNPVYSTGDDELEMVPDEAAPFIPQRKRLGKVAKEMGTYYVRRNSKGDLVGMLTKVDPTNHMLHHVLNHTSTVTTRLSGDMQQLPRKENGTIKQVFISRWGDDGLMVEEDYSQLEVIIQQVLSQDTRLGLDINRGVDFHCIRVAAWKGCTYEEALDWCKNEASPRYAEWKPYRTAAKIFSFQRAYGAGAKKIAAFTKMRLEDVEALIEAENALYPGVQRFNADVAAEVERTAKPFYDPDFARMFRRGFWQSPTGCIYSFRTYDAPDYLKKRGVMDSFMPTEMKNYMVQGTGGEAVQATGGRLWRLFLNKDNYGGLGLLVNTVHDCNWADTHKSVTMEVVKDMKEVMESVPEIFNTTFGMNITVPFKVEAEIGPNMFNLSHPKEH